MAGIGEATLASHRLAPAGDDDLSETGGLVVLADLERMTSEELERACVALLRDPAEPREAPLPSRPASAAVARRTVLALLRLWGLHQLLEAGELLTGELVANAVRHTGGRIIGLRVIRRPGWLRVEVRDSSRALPCLIVANETGYATGNGLKLVDSIAERWGADLLPRGKAVWFELKVRERAGSANSQA
ncbi:hypothetical protein GCM10023235_49190 [Kitasatospora terrestris]|uniref:Histidine kinase/HSP90-like ATPase domain-containing protein n=2 Tax=Kitasatospora terrestris TaxID=258051 RepID=A0ABP9E0Z5_9ACTN